MDHAEAKPEAGGGQIPSQQFLAPGSPSALKLVYSLQGKMYVCDADAHDDDDDDDDDDDGDDDDNDEDDEEYDDDHDADHDDDDDDDDYYDDDDDR